MLLLTMANINQLFANNVFLKFISFFFLLFFLVFIISQKMGKKNHPHNAFLLFSFKEIKTSLDISFNYIFFFDHFF